MPPIKRTKFKLGHDQLLEMFYWLKLIRAFDERLSNLVKQGKVRSGVYTGKRTGSARCTAISGRS
jgi:TPP-dependent pyruvate/acetoin dehydrogenase alpha subunit